MWASDHKKRLRQPYRAGDILIDSARGRLSRNGREVSLEPKVLALLESFIASQGTVRSRDDLITDVWGIEHGGDESLTRAVSILRKAFESLGTTSVRIETYHKRGYRLVVDGIENVPSDLSDKIAVDRPEAPLATEKDRPKASRHWLLALCIGIALPLVLAFFRVVSTIGTPPDALASELTATATNQFLIGEFDALSATPRTTALTRSLPLTLSRFLTANRLSTRTTPVTAPETVPEFTIEGGVDAQSTDIRLIHTSSGEVVWSQSFDLSDMAEDKTPDIISAQVAMVMQCVVRDRAADYPSAVSTLRLYAQNCEDRSMVLNPSSTHFFEAIHRAEPDNPKAMGLYASGLQRRVVRGDAVTPSERERMADHAGELFKTLDDIGYGKSDPAYRSLRVIFEENDPQTRDRVLQAAVASEDVPGIASVNYASFLRSVGRIKDATMVFETLADAFPYDPAIQARYAWLLRLTGEVATYKAVIGRVREFAPDWSELAHRELQWETYIGDPVRALEIHDARDLWTAMPQHMADCTREFLRLRASSSPPDPKFKAACREALDEDSWWAIRMHTVLGDVDRAFAIAQKADWAYFASTITFFYPDNAPLWRDVRFWTLMEDIGLLDYWRGTDRWPDFCDDPELDVPCRQLADQVSKL